MEFTPVPKSKGQGTTNGFLGANVDRGTSSIAGTRQKAVIRYQRKHPRTTGAKLGGPNIVPVERRAKLERHGSFCVCPGTAVDVAARTDRGL